MGDTVRIPKIHKIEKGYKQQWSYELHTIDKLLQNGLYEVDGSIYPRKELLLVKSAPVKNDKPVDVESEKINKINVAKSSKLLKEIADHNPLPGEMKRSVRSTEDIEADLTSGRVLRSRMKK